MKRREFLKTTAASTMLLSVSGNSPAFAFDDDKAACCDRTYASPADAIKAPPETLAYVPAIYVGTDVKKPDYLATVDVDPNSDTFSQVISRLPMPNVGDELHHFGWNACSSCHGEEGKHRRFIVLPGIGSGRIHICLLYTSPSPRDRTRSRMPSSA